MGTYSYYDDVDTAYELYQEMMAEREALEKQEDIRRLSKAIEDIVKTLNFTNVYTVSTPVGVNPFFPFLSEPEVKPETVALDAITAQRDRIDDLETRLYLLRNL